MFSSFPVSPARTLFVTCGAGPWAELSRGFL
jgi:hypothetical protein